jgi:hypothetical protein
MAACPEGKWGLQCVAPSFQERGRPGLGQGLGTHTWNDVSLTKVPGAQVAQSARATLLTAVLNWPLSHLPAAQVALGVRQDFDQAFERIVSTGPAMRARDDLLGQQGQQVA